MIEFQKNNASLSFSEALLKGKDGEDGGYYKPSINGNLISWQPSKTDMPQVADSALTLRAEDIDYINSKVPSSQQEEGVKGALDYLLSYTPHTHYNKLALDKLSTDNASSTALFINGRSNKIALEPKIFNYASYTSATLNLTNNSYYILRQVHKLTINPPSTPTVAADVIWITFADEGDIELAFPTTVKYIGKIPTVKNGETWEVTIINKVVSIQKVGEGA
jgi:hypothetical protein